MDAIFPIVMVLLLGGVMYWLYQKNAADLRKLGEELGLAVIPKGEEERGQAHVTGTYWQKVMLAGEMHGYPAVVMSRGERRGGKMRSHFTVLALELPRETGFKLTVAPARTAALLAFLGSEKAAIKTGDAAFDEFYRVSGEPEEAVRRFLDEPMRKMLTAFRGGAAPGMPDHLLGRFSGDLLTGAFTVEARRVCYTISGTPMPGLAERLKMASRLLAEMARHLP